MKGVSAWSIPVSRYSKSLSGATTVMLGLGSSLGDRLHHLRRGVLFLMHHPQIYLESMSSIWQTQPIGAAKNHFYNMCVRIQTTLSELELLDVLLHIERQCGRIRGVHWMDRSLDLDLLLFGEQVVDLPRLTIPHPRMFERLFVMLPLCEVGLDFVKIAQWYQTNQKSHPIPTGMWKVGHFAFVKV